MKELIKNLTPPILWNKLLYIKNYLYFLKYKELIIKNIKLKDIHKGKRCFILGSAPSIKEEDLRPLKNEIVFALNNFYVHEDFEEIISGDVPKYYVVAPIHPPQTEIEWKRWFEDMEKHVSKNTVMFFGLNNYAQNIKYLLEKYGLFNDHLIYWFYGGIHIDKNYIFDSKDLDISRMIWGASSVSTYALIIAIYMGFDKIYLLGIDHNYICLEKEEDYRFYKNAVHQLNEEKRMKLKKSDLFFGTGKVFLEKELIAENIEKHIFNCSSKSLLNMFKKVSLKEILK